MINLEEMDIFTSVVLAEISRKATLPKSETAETLGPDGQTSVLEDTVEELKCPKCSAKIPETISTNGPKTLYECFKREGIGPSLEDNVG